MKKITRSAEPTKQDIMTVKTLAEYLLCHQSTIYRLLKARKIPAFKIGSDWRFSRTAIDQWARKSTVMGP